MPRSLAIALALCFFVVSALVERDSEILAESNSLFESATDQQSEALQDGITGSQKFPSLGGLKNAVKGAVAAVKSQVGGLVNAVKNKLRSGLKSLGGIFKPRACPGEPPCSGNGKCRYATSKCVCNPPFQPPDCSSSILDKVVVNFPCFEPGDPIPGSIEVPVPKSDLPQGAMEACLRATQPDGACRAYDLAAKGVCRRICPGLQNASCSEGRDMAACLHAPCPTMVSACWAGCAFVRRKVLGGAGLSRLPYSPPQQCINMRRWFCEGAAAASLKN